MATSQLLTLLCMLSSLAAASTTGVPLANEQQQETTSLSTSMLASLSAAAGRHLRAAMDELLPKNSNTDELTGLPRGLLGKKGRSGGDIIQKSMLAKGLDTKGSSAPYGGCNQVTKDAKAGHWCTSGGVSGKPSSSLLKYGRQTIYGTLGSSQRGWCGSELKSDGDAIPVALSTKYVNGVSPNCPYCGKCICIRFTGCDTNVNKYPPPEAQKYFGKAVAKGRVMDLCPECSDDSIDLMASEPYFKAVDKSSVYGVGVWTAEWNFVPCNTDCNKFFGQ